MDPTDSSCIEAEQSATVVAAQGEENTSVSEAVFARRTAGTSSTELHEHTTSLSEPAAQEGMTMPTSAKAQSSDGLTASADAASALGLDARQTSRHSLLSLPSDSLHCVASFLTPADWASLSLTGQSAHRMCREVFRRVRMHGFRCATEVVTAWKLGQHADARELSALYIQSGVPIYPYSLGHAYHTLAWRFGVETKAMEAISSPTDESDPDVVEGTSQINDGAEATVDAFYAERFPQRGEGRFTELNGPNLSYLEEKCVFLYTREVGPDSLRGDGGSRLHRPHRPKLVVNVHRHLADQHVLGRPKVDDENGAMKAAPTSLSADFFHPHFQPRAVAETGSQIDEMNLHNTSMSSGEWDGSLDATNLQPPQRIPPPRFTTEGGYVVDGAGDEEESEVVPPRPFAAPSAAPMNPMQQAANIPPIPPPQDQSVASAQTQNTDKAILTNVQLETYSSSSANSMSEHKDATGITKSHLQMRLAFYQRRVESLLSSFDSSGVDECLLDFWDEFLPLTKNIHFYDRHTAVPRKASLESFLTTPCPKAIGIVQCEIERIKVSSKKKGVSVKGRLFPTYEYRLFIRDRRSSSVDSSSSDDPDSVRRDTVLMMAKNRGRNHPGGYVMSPSTKKGANNYYLYLPQQADIESHLKSVNSVDSSWLESGGRGKTSSKETSSATALLGRLQSNFTGTEFQIFTPTIVKKDSTSMGPSPLGKMEASSDGDNDLGYDSGVSSDNASSRRRGSGLRHRLSTTKLLSGGDSEVVDHLPQNTGAGRRRSPVPDRRRSLRRARSMPVIPYSRRSSWTSRRAIAHSVEPAEREEQPQELLCEEEDGAITYTANLLGNRPRIMDVCIPKVTLDGKAGTTWRKYLEDCGDAGDGTSGNRMLQHFRQLQQRQENNDTNNANNPTDTSQDGSTDGENDDFGLLPLQNRPPWWNVELGAFVLNFGGRVSVASVKNFQLCHRNDQDYIMLQFGRTQGRHSFTMDFQYPLTAVQAFAIAISSLQSKISFG